MTTRVLTTRADVATCPLCHWTGPMRLAHGEALSDARQHDRWHESFVVVVLFGLWWGAGWDIQPMIEWHDDDVAAVAVTPLGLDSILRELGMLP